MWILLFLLYIIVCTLVRPLVRIRTNYCGWKPRTGPPASLAVISSNGFPVYGRRRMSLQLVTTIVLIIINILKCYYMLWRSRNFPRFPLSRFLFDFHSPSSSHHFHSCNINTKGLYIVYYIHHASIYNSIILWSYAFVRVQMYNVIHTHIS